MDSVEVSLQTAPYVIEVDFDIEAIEHYDGVHTSSNFPKSSIIAADGRNPNAWLFFAYENDTYGSVGSSSGDICNGWTGAYEAYDYSNYPPGGNSDTSFVNVRWCH